MSRMVKSLSVFQNGLKVRATTSILILLRVKNKAAMISLLLDRSCGTGMLLDSGPERENVFHLLVMSSIVTKFHGEV